MKNAFIFLFIIFIIIKYERAEKKNFKKNLYITGQFVAFWGSLLACDIWNRSYLKNVNYMDGIIQ